MGKIRLNITIDEKVVEDFKAIVPDYISISGAIEAFIREYVDGYHKFDWSLEEMLDVLKGETSVKHLKNVYALENEDGSYELVEESEEALEERKRQIAHTRALEKKYRDSSKLEDVFPKSRTKVTKSLKKKGV